MRTEIGVIRIYKKKKKFRLETEKKTSTPVFA